MNTSLLTSLAQHYQWLLSLYTLVGIALVTVIYTQLTSMLVPTFKAARQLNKDTFKSKMERPTYAANLQWNRKWSLFYLLIVYAVIMPFCLTLEAQPLWSMVLDGVVILMVYDFVYYLTHRFLFHDNGILGGPLKWMHAIHHRQHNPCKGDSSYIHPLEVAIGLGLYVATIYVLSWFMGNFHVATVVITFIAFSGINTHNHALWEADSFPFRYLNYASRMHHNHHKQFTGGNYATITLLYDWMFGTLDDGSGWKERKQAVAQQVES